MRMRVRVRVRAIACDVVPCETSHDVEGWMQITWERTWKRLLDKPGTQQERQESTMTADRDFSTPERGHKKPTGTTTTTAAGNEPTPPVPTRRETPVTSPKSWGRVLWKTEMEPAPESQACTAPRCSFWIQSTLSHPVGENGTSLHTGVDDWAIASQHTLDPGGRIRGAEG